MPSKTIIGVLASADDVQKNNELIATFEKLYDKDTKLLEKYHFLFTGGTFERLILGVDKVTRTVEKIKPLQDRVRKLIAANSTSLPGFEDGGIIILSYLITQRVCSILWIFLTPLTTHWLNPEDLALMRLSDVHRVKKLMNSGSVEEWFSTESKLDIFKNLQPVPPNLKLIKSNVTIKPIKLTKNEIKNYNKIEWRTDKFPDFEDDLGKVTIALIAHNEMKPRMIEFAIDYENELAKFDKILTTGTTGKEILNVTNKLSQKIKRYHSGPIGGDIEIATEILFNKCHIVIFFIDPLNPHPHLEDIRVIQGACMRHNLVRMLANEMQAREWMERVVKMRRPECNN